MASGLRLARFRCTGCGDCCRELSVPVTFADLARLHRASGLELEALVHWANPDEVDISGEPSSLVLLPQGRRLAVLARAGSGCRFLAADDRCKVHAFRPAACRAYPLHAELGDRGGLKRLRLLGGGACPHELGDVSELARVRREHALLRDELRMHHAAVARWNRFQQHRRRVGRPLAPAQELFARALVAQPQLSQPISDMPMQP